MTVALLLALVLASGPDVCAAAGAAQDPPQDLESVNAPVGFAEWLGDLVAEARTRGFEDTLIDRTLVGLEPLPRVIRSDRTQAEVIVTLDRYLATRVTPQVVRRGRELARQHRAALNGIERAYEVQRRFLLSIWGIETRYGRATGNTPVFRALATLAWEPRRSAFFRGELFDALTMVARGHIEPQSMTGSWAGAMGQAQFMPSSYLKFAVDFDGDGRRDIWRSTADALASIANYLKGWGWNRRETWGREVRVSEAARTRIAERVEMRTDGCSAMRTMTSARPLEQWQALGVRRLDGASLPRTNLSAGLVAVGGRHFLVYSNYDAILRYNCAHNYALSVALLADELGS